MLSKIHLKKNEERRLNSGHLWIFSNEVGIIDENPENGDLVEVYDVKGNFCGTGIYNKNSLISVRILSRNKIDNLYELLKQKLLSAAELRKSLYPSRSSYRLVFSESDFLPGLIIDRYNNTFVLQIYSFGMEKNIEIIINILKEEFDAENIFTKNEAYFRKLEGLPEEDRIYYGSMKTEMMDDGGIKYKIGFESGQKTGFYFDQCDNRSFIEKICQSKSVADLFCNSGGFGLHAAKAGASSVTFVDSSSAEIENAKYNFQLNELKCNYEFIATDVFDFVEKSISENRKYDLVILDPPAFAKSKKSLPTAKKGYEKLNRLGLQIVSEGGFLATSSCSHHLGKDEFIQIINSAATKAGKNIQLIHFNGASLDHPELPGMNETAYLKFGVFKINWNNIESGNAKS
jgi:23S rRNA (cytosine1962-C5)-methyltransferase